VIVADLKNIPSQIASTPNMEKALHFLQHLPSGDLPDGRIEIDGDRVYALVQSYTTLLPSEPITFEVHRKYIDVQYMASGQEVIAWASVAHLPVTAEYEEAKEAWFGVSPAARATLARLAPGELGIFYPTDAHAPRLADGEPAAVRKIVVKVAVGG
jgi:YhcH/YjgK/YiaL family protein